MSPEDFAVVQPYLVQPISEIDDFLSHVPDADQSRQEFVDAYKDGLRGDDLPDLKTTGPQPWLHWSQSVETAAAWLRKCGLEVQAAGIRVELAKLPARFSTDSDNSLYPPKQLIVAQAVAQRVKTILTACLTAVASASKSGQGEGTGGKDQGGQSNKRGRPKDTNATEDQRIYEAWKTQRYRRYEDLGAELKLTKHNVKCAIDRHSKRLRKAADVTE